MTEHDDSTTTVEEYLQCLRDHAGAGIEEVTDEDIGEGVLEPDFRSQLLAIRIVLERNHEAEEKVSAEIKKIEADIRERGSNSRMVDHWVNKLHSSTFLDAAHSMAAVGLIAPLMESLFDRAFRYLEHEVGQSYSVESEHERWRLDDPWDHRLVWKRGCQSRNIAKGIVQLAEAIDFKEHLPNDLERTLTILFRYRNKMFHFGLEWPGEELEKFADVVASNGWTDCFTRAASDGDPWIFYMSREFVGHCLDTVDQVIEGVGAHVRLSWAHDSVDV